MIPNIIDTEIRAGITRHRDDVEALARALQADPELAFSEHRAAGHITTLLARHGFDVTMGVAGIETAFTASIGTGPVVVLCAEYDALPDLGHACGHHLIAGSAVGAALALASVADTLGVTIRVVGTPAEEHGGGKALLLEHGVFERVRLALMLHPVPVGVSLNPFGTTTQAVGRFRAVFSGRAAHAAVAPHLGVNAADAATLAHVAVGLLRQQLHPDERVALITREAGVVTNVIPDHAVVEFECRAYELDDYRALLTRVTACFEGAALATGARLSIKASEPLYEPLVQDAALSEHWLAACAAVGLDTAAGTASSGGSTDMGNVSRVVPSLHPWFPIPGVTDPIHSPGFALAANTDAAYAAMSDGAAALALTVSRAARFERKQTDYA